MVKDVLGLLGPALQEALQLEDQWLHEAGSLIEDGGRANIQSHQVSEEINALYIIFISLSHVLHAFYMSSASEPETSFEHGHVAGMQHFPQSLVASSACPKLYDAFSSGKIHLILLILLRISNLRPSSSRLWHVITFFCFHKDALTLGLTMKTHAHTRSQRVIGV